MGLGYKQSDLQANAQAKLDDAIILLQHKKFSNAYYLAGYAVEIGLKACIAAQMTTGTIPEKSFFKKFFDHLLPGLIGLAGLASQLEEQKDKDSAFAANWAIVSEWSPEARYEASDPISAQTLIDAISDPTSGVFQWIKTYW